MRPTLVTGANGHVGSNVCRLLVARGERVRAMMRAGAEAGALSGLDVEIVRADIVDAEATARAVEGCGRVYHTAAGFVMWSPDPERDIVAPTVVGTRQVLTAAVRAGVDKVLYTSTIGTIGVSASSDRALDETSFNADPHTHYVRAKIAAEREAFAIAARAKMPLTSIHPGLVVGPRFLKPSDSVRPVADFVNRGLRFYFDGGFGLVDVEDVARSALLAMDDGRDGERYIVSGENVTVKKFLALLADLTGLKAPAIKVPLPLLPLLAAAMECVARLSGTRPLLDRSQVREFAGKYAYADSSKAERELGYTHRSARHTLSRTVAWLLDHGFVSERRKRVLRPHPSLRHADSP